MKTSRKLLLATLVSTTLGVVAMPALAGPDDWSKDARIAHFDGDRGPPPAMHGGPHDRGGPGGPGMMRFKGGPGGPRFAGPMGGPGMGPGGPGGPDIEMILERFDANGDGEITRDEVTTVTADKVKQFDANGDGQLSLEEYKALWTDQMNRMIVRSFQFHDPDGDAQVTIEEYATPLDRMFTRFDRDGDGTITAGEFAPPRGGPGMHGDGPRGPGMGPGGPGGPGGPDVEDGAPG